MRDLIAGKNIPAIMKLAHRGVITEEFLDVLINLRDEYDRNKHLSDVAMKLHLDRFLEI